jgi:hypothetical protein
MLNAHVGLQMSENLAIGIFAQNLINDRGFTGPVSIEGLAGRSRPRTFGVEFSTKFD